MFCAEPPWLVTPRHCLKRECVSDMQRKTSGQAQEVCRQRETGDKVEGQVDDIHRKALSSRGSG